MSVLVTLLVLSLLGQNGFASTLVHTTTCETGDEVIPVITVALTTAQANIPTGYTAMPASYLGVGTATQGVVVVVQFQCTNFKVDGVLSEDTHLSAYVGVLVLAPAHAPSNPAGSLHLYVLRVHTNDEIFFEAVQDANIPVERNQGLELAVTKDINGNLIMLNVTVPGYFKTGNSCGAATVPRAGKDAFLYYDNGSVHSLLYYPASPTVGQGSCASTVYPLSSNKYFSGLIPANVDVPGLHHKYDLGNEGQIIIL
jgi:hypothetical protein